MGFSLRFINLHGFPSDTTIIRDSFGYLNFYICPHFYSLPLHWKILQKVSPANSRGFIVVEEIMDKNLKFIYDKFDRIKNVTHVEKKHGYFGVPQSVIQFFDQNLIVEITDKPV